MKATIDDKGRVEIPRELRDRLHLAPGDVVDLTVVDDALNLAPAPDGVPPHQRDVKLVHDGSLLLLSGSEPLTFDQANRALEKSRHDRLHRIADETGDPR